MTWLRTAPSGRKASLRYRRVGALIVCCFMVATACGGRTSSDESDASKAPGNESEALTAPNPLDVGQAAEPQAAPDSAGNGEPASGTPVTSQAPSPAAETGQLKAAPNQGRSPAAQAKTPADQAGKRPAAAGPSAGAPATGPAGSQTASGAPTSGDTSVVPACTSVKPPIVIGTVGNLSGVVSVAMIPGVKAVQSWVQATNAKGGINCQPVKYIAKDDGADPSRHLSLMRELVERDRAIAVVYGTAVLSGEASKDYLTQKNIPYVGNEHAESHTYDTPVYFNQGASGGVVGGLTQVIVTRDVAIPQGKKKAGIITCQEAAFCATFDKTAASEAPKAGFQVVYQSKASLAQVDFTSQCLGARNAGAEVLFNSFTPEGHQRLARSCQSINYKPLISVFGAQSDESFARDPNMKGALITSMELPWFLTNNPAIAELHATLKKYAQGQPANMSTVDGWTSIKLFERALQIRAAQGPFSGPDGTVSTADVFKGLWSLNGDDLGGLTYPQEYAEGQPPPRVSCGWAIITGSGEFTTDGKMRCQ